MREHADNGFAGIPALPDGVITPGVGPGDTSNFLPGVNLSGGFLRHKLEVRMIHPPA